ncbi:MAG: DUF362 domain-containing protein [Candidatus Aminicenantia bacterium]
MAKSRIVIVKGKNVIRNGNELNPYILFRMLEKGISLLTQTNDFREGLSSFYRPRDRVGIKINTIAGKKLSTQPRLAFGVAHLLEKSGIKKRNIIIWDRTNRELKKAGYRLNFSGSGVKIFGTDTKGVDYDLDLTIHLNIGSRLSRIQSSLTDTSVSLAILKDHGLAGITAGMKNYFGTIHNPNKYHDYNCNPFVAELNDINLIKNKNKLSILDALIVQYHRGPSYHPQWAEKYESLVFGTDPVATDFIGWQIIEKLRTKKGLPSLKEEKREPAYLFTAAEMGLGKADLNQIQLIETEI